MLAVPLVDAKGELLSLLARRADGSVGLRRVRALDAGHALFQVLESSSGLARGEADNEPDESAQGSELYRYDQEQEESAPEPRCLRYGFHQT